MVRSGEPNELKAGNIINKKQYSLSIEHYSPFIRELIPKNPPFRHTFAQILNKEI